MKVITIETREDAVNKKKITKIDLVNRSDGEPFSIWLSSAQAPLNQKLTVRFANGLSLGSELQALSDLSPEEENAVIAFWGSAEDLVNKQLVIGV